MTAASCIIFCQVFIQICFVRYYDYLYIVRQPHGYQQQQQQGRVMPHNRLRLLSGPNVRNTWNKYIIIWPYTQTRQRWASRSRWYTQHLILVLKRNLFVLSPCVNWKINSIINIYYNMCNIILFNSLYCSIFFFFLCPLSCNVIVTHHNYIFIH